MNNELDPITNIAQPNLAEAEMAAQQLLVRLFYCLDRQRFDPLPRLFAENAEWQRADGTLKGRGGIAKFLGERDNSQMMRHVLTNVWVSAVSTEAATFSATVTVFADAGAASPPPAPPLYRLGRVRDVSGEVRRTAQGWLLWRLAIDKVFKE